MRGLLEAREVSPQGSSRRFFVFRFCLFDFENAKRVKSGYREFRVSVAFEQRYPLYFGRSS